MGKSVLSSQFVTGLGPDHKNKINGLEGDMDSLLIRGRFKDREEATKSTMKKSTVALEGSKPSPREQENKVRYAPRTVPSHLKCHSCGGRPLCQELSSQEQRQDKGDNRTQGCCSCPSAERRWEGGQLA